MLVKHAGTLFKEEHRPLPPTLQVSKYPATAGPADKHRQRNTMPKWPNRQQVGQTVKRSERHYYSVATKRQFTGVQATEAVGFKAVGFESAKHMTNHISKQWQIAAHSVKHSRPDKVLEAYYSCMDQTVAILRSN